MKAKLMLVLSMVAILLAVVACSVAQAGGTGNQARLEVTIDQFTNDKHITRQIEVGDEGTLTLILGSNQTTGFQWSEQAQIGDQNVLLQTGHKYTGPEAGLIGAAGKQEWTFKALKKGQTTVSMDYSRPWEGGEKGEWTFTLNVVVK